MTKRSQFNIKGVSVETLAVLHAEAARTGVSFSDVVRQTLDRRAALIVRRQQMTAGQVPEGSQT